MTWPKRLCMLDTRTNKKRCDAAMHVYNERSNNKPTHKLQRYLVYVK